MEKIGGFNSIEDDIKALDDTKITYPELHG